jgi:hypothetical protein
MASKPSREKEDAVKIRFYHRAALVAAVAVTAFWAVRNYQLARTVPAVQ